MARRIRPQSTPRENFSLFIGSIPWKLFLIVIVLLVLGVPTFLYGQKAGNTAFTSITDTFMAFSNKTNDPTPTPQPAFPRALPQVGTTLYTVEEGDNCNDILAYYMRMDGAGQVFSDVKPNTIQALNQAIGQDCHKIQPGMILALPPHYPMVAMGGKILKIESTTPRQVLPTPLISVPKEEYTPDCTDGCALTVQITPSTQVRLIVRSSLALRPGGWTWFQAAMERKKVAGFKEYPYTDPNMKWNGMTLHACDFQVDTAYDENTDACEDLQPNTIDTDGGTWLYAVTGTNGIDHWRYKLKAAPAGTSVLLWLTSEKGRLVYHPGDPAYRYDDAAKLYVKW